MSDIMQQLLFFLSAVSGYQFSGISNYLTLCKEGFLFSSNVLFCAFRHLYQRRPIAKLLFVYQWLAMTARKTYPLIKTLLFKEPRNNANEKPAISSIGLQ